MGLTIRDYAPSDAAACRALWVELTQHHRDIYDDQSIGGDDPGRAFEHYLAGESLRGPWVAELTGDVVGLTGLLVEGEIAEIEPVVVTVRRRAEGIGTRLVEHAVQEARGMGIRTLQVRPTARNLAAISFFVNLGFDTVGQIDLLQDVSADPERVWRFGLAIHGHDLKY